MDRPTIAEYVEDQILNSGLLYGPGIGRPTGVLSKEGRHMSDDKRRETKPARPVETATPRRPAPKETAVDRRPIERPTQQPVERKA